MNNNISFNLIDLVKDSYGIYYNNTFTVFQSINNLLILVYSIQKSIFTFNIIDKKKINEIRNAHNELISNFRYYFDKINKRDLIISISPLDNNLKLWNINSCKCLINLQNINKNGVLLSACFLNYNNANYIISSNSNNKNGKSCEALKVYDFNGNKIKELNDSKCYTYFVDTYYDKSSLITYILTGNQGAIRSYNYNNNKIYHKYYDNNNKNHYNIIIYHSKDNKTELIESSSDGIIRIWNFHSGVLLNNIKLNNTSLLSICLWKEDYLFVGCANNNIKIIELNNKLNIKDLVDIHDVITIKTINHYKFGECIIFQRNFNIGIQLWKIQT